MYDKILRIDEQIKYLPEPVQKNAPLTAMVELIAFEKGLIQQFDGGDSDVPFQSQWNELAMRFRRRLTETKPLISLPYMQKPSTTIENTPQLKHGTPASTPKNPVAGCIDVSSDSEDVGIQTGSKRPSTFSPRTPAKIRRTTTFQSGSKRFTLSELRDIIQSAYTGGIPSLVHPKAIEKMITLSMDHWEGLLTAFLQTTQTHCEQMIDNFRKDTFRHRLGTGFHEELTDMISHYLQGLFDKQKSLCKRLLAWELESPKTLNEEGLASARNTALDSLKDRFKLQRAHDALDAAEKKSGKPSIGQVRAEKAAKLQESQLPPDRYDLELQAMSVSLAFWQGCSFADQSP